MHQWLFMYFLTCVITTYVPIHLFITAFINLPSFIMIIFVRVCTWLGAVWPGSGLYAGLPGDREGAGGGARGADAAGATPLQQPLHIIQLRPYTPRRNRLWCHLTSLRKRAVCRLFNCFLIIKTDFFIKLNLSSIFSLSSSIHVPFPFHVFWLSLIVSLFVEVKLISSWSTCIFQGRSGES